MFGLIGGIIFLVLVLVVMIAAWTAYRNISNKVKRFSMQAFGTLDISKGLKQVEADYASTAKSVSGGTSIYLPRIAKDFPEFDYDEMKRRAENVLTSYLCCIDQRNEGGLTEGTVELKDQLALRLNMLEDNCAREHYEQIKIHRTEINQYRKEKGRCTVVFQSAVEYYTYQESGGKLLSGSRDVKKQSRYNVECVYVQDRELVESSGESALGLNCPNCGAPIPALGAKHCAYCGTPVIEYNIRTWGFCSVREG